MALNALAIDVMLPALPYMGEALGISHENERQYVVGIYMLGFGLAQLAFGPLTDRFGRRAPLLVGLAIYLVCAFAATFAPNFGVLLALRFVQDWAPPARVSSPPPSSRPLLRPRDGRDHVADLHVVHGHSHHRAGHGQVLLMTARGRRSSCSWAGRR